MLEQCTVCFIYYFETVGYNRPEFSFSVAILLRRHFINWQWTIIIRSINFYSITLERRVKSSRLHRQFKCRSSNSNIFRKLFSLSVVARMRQKFYSFLNKKNIFPFMDRKELSHDAIIRFYPITTESGMANRIMDVSKPLLNLYISFRWRKKRSLSHKRFDYEIKNLTFSQFSDSHGWDNLL